MVRKYRNQPITIQGQRFDSRSEAVRYGELALLATAGEIHRLECQPSFPLHVNGVRIGAYRADFSYWQGGERVVEDVKSPPTRTPLYRWKIKHLRAEYGITVTEVIRRG